HLHFSPTLLLYSTFLSFQNLQKISNFVAPNRIKMVVAQKVKEAEITEQGSLLLTRNLLRIAIFNISYIRGLFPEKYFSDKSVPALEMKIKKLMPVDADSRVYDALQKKYLKTLFFCICETMEGAMIEEYTFSFSYPNPDSQEVSMNFNRTGSKKKGGELKCHSTTEVTPSQMKFSACKMTRTLVQLMRTLDKMPEERTILMKLLYYDDVTPADYEPPFFRSCTTQETHNQWTKSPLKMDVGNVNSKHFVLAVKVKSVLDPCEGDSDSNHEDDVSLGADSTDKDCNSDTDTEVGTLQENPYIVAPAGKQQQFNDGVASEDGTQDEAEDEKQLCRVKDWIITCHLETLNITDILVIFPDISVLVDEGILSEIKRDTYAINRQKLEYFEFQVKDEADDQVLPALSKTPPQREGEDYLYMKALLYALPMDYVTAPKLIGKLDGEASQATVRKLIDRMTAEGFAEPQSNRRLGRRVIHSDLAEKKLSEVRKALDLDAMEVDVDASQDKTKLAELQKTVGSTCGAVHSIGSDLTRAMGKAVTLHDGSVRSEQTVLPGNEQPNTPTSKAAAAAAPVASRESIFPGNDKGRSFANNNVSEDASDNMNCSRSTQGKRSRKASIAREPILHYAKRQKPQLA
ncbi:hypothetical protein V2J09_016260, partial [Rumex salicifolius]